MLQVEYTTKFKRDLKLAKRRNKNMVSIVGVVGGLMVLKSSWDLLPPLWNNDKSKAVPAPNDNSSQSPKLQSTAKTTSELQIDLTASSTEGRKAVTFADHHSTTNGHAATNGQAAKLDRKPSIKLRPENTQQQSWRCFR